MTMNLIRITATNELLTKYAPELISAPGKSPVYTKIPGRKGETFLDIIRKGDFPDFQAPCGGSGTCGKCRIRILSGFTAPVSPEELDILSKEDIESNIRLACRTRFDSDGTSGENTEVSEPVHILIHQQSGSQVSTGSKLGGLGENFRYRLFTPYIPAPTLEDQRSTLERLEVIEEGHNEKIPGNVSASILKKLARLVPGDSQPAGEKLLFDAGQLVDVVQPHEKVLGFAVDIGTTTIVIRLLDMLSGKEEGVVSGLNAQRSRGADVISRINYGTESPEKLSELKELIVNQLDEAMSNLLEENGFEKEWVKRVTVAGNTTMLHLLLGVDPSGIASAPFIPVFVNPLSLNAGEAGFTSVPGAVLDILPSVAAYVGADITAGMGVSEIDSHDCPVLFIDIGTNGEMALAHDGRIICCSTAAGPAFEGANISCGTGGIPGAVDKVRVHGKDLSWSTINDLPPVGICGSGIIDIAALLVETGAADYTGRILSSGESGFPWIADGDEGSLLRINGNGKVEGADILFTQKDLREVQLAKAAIAGGIRTLVKEAGLELEDIGKVVLAGGFGSYIDPESAGRIGLLPGELWKITTAAGNTSGAGAAKVLMEAGAEEKYSALARSCDYVELSSNPDFQNYYIDEMCFPEVTFK